MEFHSICAAKQWMDNIYSLKLNNVQNQSCRCVDWQHPAHECAIQLTQYNTAYHECYGILRFVFESIEYYSEELSSKKR